MDIIVDSILDTLKIIPFLFISFIIMEMFEHKFDNRKFIIKKSILSPIIGAILGTIPQCGLSAVSANLYAAKIISLGTLIAVFLTTSDEMLPLLIAEGSSVNLIFKIILTKFIIGLVFGILIDLVYKNKNTKDNYDICDKDMCHCKDGIIKSSLIHTAKIILFILFANIFIGFIIDEDILINILESKKFLTPIIAILVGLIPNCASSVIITKLYLANIISFGSAIAGLLSCSGIGILILFKQNKNMIENIIILFLLVGISSFVGIILNIL